MADSTARYDDFLAKPDRASLHVTVNGTWVAAPARRPDAHAPAGGISSSINDMATWARLVLGAGKLDGKELIDEDALATTHEPHIVRRPLDSYDAQASLYGLGWGVDPNDHLGFLRWAHSGAFSAGASTTVALLPTEQLGVVVLTNAKPMGVPEIIADEIIDQIATGGLTQDWRAFWNGQVFGEMAAERNGPEPPAKPKPAQPNEAYIGTYHNDVFGDVEVIAQGAGLALDFGQPRNTYPLTHFDGDTFTFLLFPEEPNSPFPVVFTIGSDGTATSMDLGGIEGPDVGVLQRVP
jgi:hypothetical protein